MRPLLSNASSFTRLTVDKVERLLEVLAALSDDPLLGSVFVLHGGTALNVFSEDLPRLSVDVDLMYVGQLEVSAMQTERPRVDARLRNVVGKLGYTVSGTNDEHSGQTYRLKYGGEYIKIDVTYLARALIDPVMQWKASNLKKRSTTAQWRRRRLRPRARRAAGEHSGLAQPARSSIRYPIAR